MTGRERPLTAPPSVFADAPKQSAPNPLPPGGAPWAGPSAAPSSLRAPPRRMPMAPLSEEACGSVTHLPRDIPCPTPAWSEFNLYLVRTGLLRKGLWAPSETSVVQLSRLLRRDQSPGCLAAVAERRDGRQLTRACSLGALRLPRFLPRTVGQLARPSPLCCMPHSPSFPRAA